MVVVDSVRLEAQIQAIRHSGWQVTHVHLTAAQEVLAKRYGKRRNKARELGSYAALSESETERNVEELGKTADVVINTDRCNLDDVYARVASRLETRPVTAAPLVDVLIGGQYGSEGKGNIVHFLAPEYDVLVRVGGPNAGHKVWQRGGEAFTFHQVPSGAIANPSAKLIIGAGAVVSLTVLRTEIAKLGLDINRLMIDPRAMVIEDEDVAWENAQLRNEIASTAQGVGKATARKIMHRYPNSDVRLVKDVPALEHYVGDTIEFFAQCLSEGKRIMLEGTQGTSLGIHHGPYPHVTSRVTSAPGCLAEAGLSARHVRKVVMVCRTYPIRVGDTDTGKTSGPMSAPINLKVIHQRSRIPLKELERTERTSTTNRPRRIAEFDWAQLRRSLLLNGPTDIALTFADYLGVENREAYRYEQLNEETLRFVEEVEKVSGVPVSLISTAFNDRNVIDRRLW
ncbi:adenylosuccinate synthetase [Ideonella sp. 4Y16]|uniref:Adenylosuccinate synthetase n=1 Tax=Ideonella aquatica TaxID=2824119 RepID=A0A940YQ60_9BURK|nr:MULTISPECIES: adenylosuccinate synthetase [Ideonella]MBQ0946303.1 adenylosuccinate synthetase [Ideonella alba]MBQ0961999.1 adenylosuccinate synthetase [Ideonella aquatica]